MEELGLSIKKSHHTEKTHHKHEAAAEREAISSALAGCNKSSWGYDGNLKFLLAVEIA